MPTELSLDLSLVDHHCHGVSPADLDYKAFQAMFSESYLPPPDGTSEFQKPLGLVIRRFCAPVLDLEPLCKGEAYVARRLELGAAEVNRRFLTGSGLDRLLVDTGHRSDAILGCQDMGRVSGRPAHEVVRIEAVAEGVARSGASAGDFPDAFAAALEARTKEAVGLKTIVAYRTTFRIDQSAPAKADVIGAAGAWFRKANETGRWRLDDGVIVRHGLWLGAELCRARKLPMQVHVGFGDPEFALLQAVDDAFDRRPGRAFHLVDGQHRASFPGAVDHELQFVDAGALGCGLLPRGPGGLARDHRA